MRRSAARHLISRSARPNPIRVPSFALFRPASVKASKVMRANRREGGRAERLLAEALRNRGIRFESHVTNLPGCPDIVLAPQRVAVFCDGDFWHGRRWTKLRGQLLGRANAAYWVAKIGENRRRDRRQTLALRTLG